MKTTKIITLIILGFMIGAFATNIYAASVKLIMVPEYIGNYKTVDLLEYVMKQKQKEDAKVQKVSVPEKKEQPKKTKNDKINFIKVDA